MLVVGSTDGGSDEVEGLAEGLEESVDVVKDGTDVGLEESVDVAKDGTDVELEESVGVVEERSDVELVKVDPPRLEEEMGDPEYADPPEALLVVEDIVRMLLETVESVIVTVGGTLGTVMGRNSVIVVAGLSVKMRLADGGDTVTE